MNNGSLHDSFFKSALGDKEVLVRTLKGLLPHEISREIDFETLVFPEESVGEGLGASRMDMVFSVRMEGGEIWLSLILEHKSSPDPATPFQLLRYVSASWSRMIRHRETPRPVLPVLFTHGKEPWKHPASLSEILNTPMVLKSLIPDYTLLTVDLASVSDREILRQVDDIATGALLLSMKHIFEGPAEVFSAILKNAGSRKDLYDILKPVLGLIINYVTGVHNLQTPEEIRKVLAPVIVEAEMPDMMEMILEEGR